MVKESLVSVGHGVGRGVEELKLGEEQESSKLVIGGINKLVPRCGLG